jgi:hypothetical protein
MIPKYLMFAVGLAVTAVAVAVAAMEVAVQSQIQQDAHARGCNNSVAFNASKGRCLKGLQAEEATKKRKTTSN